MGPSLTYARREATSREFDDVSPSRKHAEGPGHWSALALAPQVLRSSDGALDAERVAVDAVAGDALGAGRPLAPTLREEFETRLGTDLAGVRIHTEPRAARAAAEIRASAYAIGEHVAFNAGRYEPDTARGRTLLAHELAHVALSRGSRVPASGTVAVSRPGDPAERQADRLARGALKGSAPAAASGPATVARQELAEEVAATPAQAASASPMSSGSSPGASGSGGAPPASVPDFSFVMGGRTVDYWAARVIDAHHTYMNVKENASTYWLVEAGPRPGDPTHVGAWAKPGNWESRGNRVTATLNPTDFAAAKAQLMTTQSVYHSMVIPYHAWDGPNSNSFIEQTTTREPRLPRAFWTRDIEWDYWRGHTRPF